MRGRACVGRVVLRSGGLARKRAYPCDIVFGGARKDVADVSSGTIALSFRVATAGRYMANLRHEPCAPGHGECCVIMRRPGANCHMFISKTSISPRQFRDCVALFCYARVVAWRSLLEVRLNACFCYIDQGERCHRSKYRGSFDFSTADEVVAPALLAAAVISSIVCDKTAGRGLARTKEQSLAWPRLPAPASTGVARIRSMTPRDLTRRSRAASIGRNARLRHGPSHPNPATAFDRPAASGGAFA